jgi:hypothetical protein
MGTPTAVTTPGPPATAIATPTPRESDGGTLAGLLGDDGARITARGGTLPLDPTLVYDRTRRLLGTEAPRPGTVQLLDTTANTTRPPEFQRLLGLERNVSEVEAVAFVVGPRTVYINRNLTDRPARLEHVLAHEFTHTVQFRRGVVGRVTAATDAGPDGRFASTAVIEGAATYTEDRYWLAYLANGTDAGTRPGADVERRHRAGEGAVRYALAPYRFGYRYANATVAGPADLDTVYADPPLTGEQVLHPGTREAPVALQVTLRGERTGTWRETFSPRRGRVGEALLRTALATELDAERAARAAAGWGNDTRIAFNDPAGTRGYAWVLRFDDDADASEFDAAVRTYLDRRTDGTGAPASGGRGSNADAGTRWEGTLDDRTVAYRLVRVDTRTAVLLVGAPAFVDPGTTTVSSEAGRVVVATDNEST